MAELLSWVLPVFGQGSVRFLSCNMLTILPTFWVRNPKPKQVRELKSVLNVRSERGWVTLVDLFLFLLAKLLAGLLSIRCSHEGQICGIGAIPPLWIFVARGGWG